MRYLIHKALDRPASPARADGSQIARPEGPVGQVISQRANTLPAYCVPVVGALNRERIVQNAFGVLALEIGSNGSGGPTGCRVVIHSCNAVVVSPGQTQDLRRGGSGTVEAHVVGSGADHLDRFSDRLGGKAGRDDIIAVKATTECSTK